MFIASLIRLVRKYLQYRATLSALGNVDDRTLRDIGLHRSQIMSAAWTVTDDLRS